ncbi:MAG: DUF4136 domain-containing protein [Mariprofundaceae bacterium]|nr:DUF4136 domain-containing protein [Mariprofundaceae bacterium]
MPLFKLFVVGLILSVFPGCGMLVKSHVTRFHDGLDKLRASNNTAFAVMPYKEQQGDLEYKLYARSISSKLVEAGFVEVGNIDKAALAVFFSYGIDSGQDVAYSYPIYGQTGGGTTSHSGTVNSYGGSASYSGTSYTTPTYGVVGQASGRKTKYTRVLKLEIVDLRNSSEKNLVIVFQGEVKSKGSSSSFSSVSECLIEAMFDKFPGANGDTSTVINSKCIKK